MAVTTRAASNPSLNGAGGCPSLPDRLDEVAPLRDMPVDADRLGIVGGTSWPRRARRLWDTGKIPANDAVVCKLATAAIGEQAQHGRPSRRQCRARHDHAQGAGCEGQQGRRRVLDRVRVSERRRLALNTRHGSEQPKHQIQIVDALVEQRAAAVIRLRRATASPHSRRRSDTNGSPPRSGAVVRDRPRRAAS